MWLVNVFTKSLEAFHGARIPPYAILSHTWEAEEVSFQEFMRASEGDDNGSITKKAGYRKITTFCDLARREGYSYVWVDTCCIDKTSSAELTEAVNSMFGWYRDSKICYAYLNFNVESSEVRVTCTEGPPMSEPDHLILYSLLRQCRWFTRGWCLQELLAPQNVHFLNRYWQGRGWH